MIRNCVNQSTQGRGWVHEKCGVHVLKTAYGPELHGVTEGDSGTQRRRLETLFRETPCFKDSVENEKKGEKRDWESDLWGSCGLLSSPSFWNVTGMLWTWIWIVRVLCSWRVVCGWSVSFFLLRLLSHPRSILSVVSYMLAAQVLSLASPWGPGLVSWRSPFYHLGRPGLPHRLIVAWNTDNFLWSLNSFKMWIASRGTRKYEFAEMPHSANQVGRLLTCKQDLRWHRRS